MPIVSEKIMRSTARSAAFAVVEVDVELINAPGRSLVEVASDAEIWHGDHYVRTAEVGVLIAAVHAPSGQRLAVRIRKLLTSNVDSTHADVLLAAARATLRALGQDPDLAGNLDESLQFVRLRRCF